MSLGKLPALKGLVPSSQTRRGVKSELSVDMISPPLGDFRHTMHVGRGGDVFGDTSFLSNYGGPSHSANAGSPSGSRTSRFLSRTLQHVRKTPVPRLRAGSRDLSSPPPHVSPIIKNAISLPQLNLSNGGLTLIHSRSSPDRALCSYALHSGFLTLPRVSGLDQSCAETAESPESSSRRSSVPEDSEVSLTRSDSLSSFTLDLGPSLVSEVLELIDRGTVPQEDHCESEMGSRRDTDVAMEPRRFRQAASVLARHFGGGDKEERRRPASFTHTRTTLSFTETEEEIKV